jgi:hypothetical protein
MYNTIDQYSYSVLFRYGLRPSEGLQNNICKKINLYSYKVDKVLPGMDCVYLRA